MKVMILAVATVKRPSDLNLQNITYVAMQVIADSVTFHLVFRAKNAQHNHPYGPTITLQQSEDECICPAALVREYLTITKDREQRSEKHFVTKKMGPAIFLSMPRVLVD